MSQNSNSWGKKKCPLSMFCSSSALLARSARGRILHAQLLLCLSMGMKIKQPAVAQRWVGRAVCQQRGCDCGAAWLAGATGTHGGTDSFQTWGTQGEMCLPQQNGSVVSCALGGGKHRVEEHRGHFGRIRKLTSKGELVLADRGLMLP